MIILSAPWLRYAVSNLVTEKFVHLPKSMRGNRLRVWGKPNLHYDGDPFTPEVKHTEQLGIVKLQLMVAQGYEGTL